MLYNIISKCAVFSQNGSFSSGVSPRFSDFVYHNGNAASDLSEKHEQTYGSQDVKEGAAKRNSSADSQLKSNSQNEMDDPSPNDKMPRSADGGARAETGIFHNCGRQNPCLPCLACVATSDEKKKSLNPTSPRSRKKSSLTQMLSFKWRETNSSSALCKPFYLVYTVNGSRSQIGYFFFLFLHKPLSTC